MRIEAEMKTPSSATPIPLTLTSSEDRPAAPASPKDSDDDENGEDGEAGKKNEGTKDGKTATAAGVDLAPGHSLQKIVNFDLKEEGSHVLAVTIVYSETTPTSGRVRTFRKLYQFVCKSCMVVRTKTALLPPLAVGSNEKRDKAGETAAPGLDRGHRRWALEAQLENSGDEIITLDVVLLETNEGLKSRGMNWEVLREGEELERPVLQPGDVQQVCFIVEETGEEARPEVNGRLVFGVLSIGWRGPMGDRGFLNTGLLGTRIT